MRSTKKLKVLILLAVLISLISCAAQLRRSYYSLTKASYYSPDGKYIFTSNLKSVEIRDTGDYKLVKIIKNENYINDIAFSSDKKYFAISDYEKNVYLFTLNNFKMIKIYKGYGGININFSPDNKLLASSSYFKLRMSDEKIIIWDVKTGRNSKVIERHDDPVKKVIFKDNNTLISVSLEAGELFIWDIKKVKIIKKIKIKSGILDIFYHRDKNILAVAHNYRTDKFTSAILFFDLSNYKIIKKLKFPKLKRKNAPFSIHISPDFKYLIISNVNRSMNIIRLADNKLIKNIWFWDVFQTLSFSPDGKYFAVTTTGLGKKYVPNHRTKMMNTNYKTKAYIYVFNAKTFELVKKIQLKNREE